MKLLLLITFISSAMISFGQTWFDIGLKGGGGTGFLINKTIADDDRLSVLPGSNYFAGGKFGINFGEQHSITFDGAYISNSFAFLQTGIASTNSQYRYEINYTTISFAPMYRRTTDASYLELGPEFSFFKGGSIVDEATIAVPVDAEDVINPTQVAAMLGFGGYVIGTEKLALSMGLRFKYTLTNLTSDSYASTNYPMTHYPDITASSTTNPLTIQVVFELNYSLAQIARASCGKRTAIIAL